MYTLEIVIYMKDCTIISTFDTLKVLLIFMHPSFTLEKMKKYNSRKPKTLVEKRNILFLCKMFKFAYITLFSHIICH